MAYYYHYLVKKLVIYHYFENMKECTIFLKFEFVMKLEIKKLEFFEKYILKNFENFL